jgi:hypothetical protein
VKLVGSGEALMRHDGGEDDEAVPWFPEEAQSEAPQLWHVCALELCSLLSTWRSSAQWRACWDGEDLHLG